MLKDYIVGLGFDAIKAKLTDAGMHHEVKEALESYIQTQLALNETCSPEEEVDFGALAEYIATNFFEDVDQRLFGATAEIRGNAHRSIVEKSNHYARANTSLTQKRVNRFVSGALNILRSFCDKQLPKELRYLSTRIADDVTSSMTIQHAEQTEHIESVIHTAVREAVQASPLSPEKGLEYAKSGQLNTIGEQMTDYFHIISSQHILFPHYGYGPQQKGQKINVVSVPMTEEAKRIYPPHFKCNGTLTIEGRTVPYPTPELFQYANDHQLPITLTITEARKYLGDIEDPQQCEVVELLNLQLVLPPKPFPEAMAYSILINDVVVNEYVLLRTQEKLEDGTIIMTNREQISPIDVCIKINPSTKRTDFSYRFGKGTNRDVLQYLYFLRTFTKGGRVVVRHLETGKNLVVANLNPYIHENGANITAEIELLEKIVMLEEHFKTQIVLPSAISSEEIELIDYLALLVQGKEVQGGWNRYEVVQPIDEQMKENLLTSAEKMHSLSWVGGVTAHLFDQDYHFTLLRTLASVVIDNYEKVKQKLTVLESGDDIRMVYLPGESSGNGIFVDKLISDDALPILDEIKK